MGVYGTTYKSAFSGLGKPSIKLEFEDNDQLLAFQRRMDAGDGDDGGDNPDGGNFTPGEQVLDRLSRIATGRPYLKATTNTPEGDDEESVVWNKKRQESESLGKAGDLYLVRDLRTRAKKEPGEVVSNKNLRFYKVEGEEVNNFNKGIYEKDAYFSRKIEGYRNIYFTLKSGQYYTEFTFFEPWKKENWNEPTLAGYWRRIETVLDINKVLNWHATPYRTDDNLQLLEDRGRTDGVIHRSAKGNTFYGWITDEYNTELRQKAFNTFYNERLTVDDKYYSKYQKKLLADFYSNPQSYKIRVIDSYSGGKTSSPINDSDRDEFIGLLQKTSLGAPGDVYLVTDTRTRPRKDLDEMTALKRYEIRRLNGEELQKMQTSDPLLYEQIKSDITGGNAVKFEPKAGDLGRAAASDALYNNNDILDCRGLKPTYKILQSYDAFFAPAQHSQTFAGVGLDDTKKLIADICKAHYKDCARIAQHLKADTKLQSVFNLWHWLRHNIRYEYDREGREEVRTPLRTWADRRRGVDCDCLSVFAWCVLKCMGYDPAFELVCFKGKKQPSHILVNLDGVRCDRVWFVFNALPPGVTNSEIYRIADRATAAQLAGLFN